MEVSEEGPQAEKRQKLEASGSAEEEKEEKKEEEEEDPAKMYPPRKCDIALLTAASDGNAKEVRRLIEEEDADSCFQDFTTGMSVLMAAAGSGHGDVVAVLLEEGAPWNALDRQHRCAGDYAARNGHQAVVDQLMTHACTCELLLGSVLKRERAAQPRVSPFLSSSLAFSGDRLVEEDAELAVMMEWERPLMERHAAFVAPGPGLAVLNVGFGMGIVDTALQARSPALHAIVEAHPAVLARARADGWEGRPGVRLLEGRWQEALPRAIEEGLLFDGVFFDTYAEDDIDLGEFHALLPRLLRPGGRYSFYNGQCPDNVFFHGVACETLRLQLRSLGFSCEFEPVPVEEATRSELWKGLKRRYWFFDTYYLPKCVRDQ